MDASTGEPPDLVGEVIADRYRIVRLLGEGGMGRVYLAEHERLGSRVAIKVLAEDRAMPFAVDRFVREARATARIGHENIVDVFDFGETSGGAPFIAMEYLEGEDLAATLGREGHLPWSRVRAVMIHCCRGLQAAHAVGVVHRDLKPENCFRILWGDDPDFIKILDFGIAKLTTREARHLTGTRGLLGTPEYMAPEQARGRTVDHRADIYALGVIAFELLTGRVPFTGDDFMGVLLQHLNDPAPVPSEGAAGLGIPTEVDAVVARAMAKDPDDRFPTMAAFGRAWQALAPAAVVSRRGTPTRAGGRSLDETAPPPVPVEPPEEASAPSRVAVPTVEVRSSGDWSEPLAPHAARPTFPGVGADPDSTEPDPEVDFAAWRVRRRWWVVAASVLAGVVVSAMIGLGQAGSEPPVESPRDVDAVVIVGPTPASNASPEAEGPTAADDSPEEVVGAAQARVDRGTTRPRDRGRQSRDRGPGRKAVRAATRAIQPLVSACAGTLTGGSKGDAVEVRMHVSGRDGRVMAARATGDRARTLLGRCVADAARKAQFEPFGGREATVTHVFRL